MKSESAYTTYAKNTDNKDGSISLWNKIDNYIHDTIKKFYPAGVYVYNMIKKIDNNMLYFIVLFIVSLVTYSFFKGYIHTLDILNAYQLEIAFAQYNPTLIRYHLYQQLLLYASEICGAELIDYIVSSISDYWGYILDKDLQHRYIETVAEQNIPKNIGNHNNRVAKSILSSIVTFAIETPHLAYQTYCLLLAHSYLIYPLLLLILGISLIRGVISIYEKMIIDETETTPKLHDFWNNAHTYHDVITAAHDKSILANKMKSILDSKAHLNSGRTIIDHIKSFIKQSLHYLGETILLLLQCKAYLTGRITLPELYANCRSILSIIYKAHRVVTSISIFKSQYTILEVLHTTEQFIAAEKKAREITTANKWQKTQENIFNIEDLRIHLPGDTNNHPIIKTIKTTIAKGKTYYIKEPNSSGKSMLCKFLHGQILCLDDLENNISSLFKSQFTAQGTLQKDDAYEVFYRTARTYMADDSVLSCIISPLTQDKITQKEVNAIHTYFKAMYKESDPPLWISKVLQALPPKNANLNEEIFSEHMRNTLSISFSQERTPPSTGTAQIIQGCGLYLALGQCTKPKLVILDEAYANMCPEKQQNFVNIIYSALHITTQEAPQDTLLVIAHTENPKDNSHPWYLQEKEPERLHIFKQNVENKTSLTPN